MRRSLVLVVLSLLSVACTSDTEDKASEEASDTDDDGSTTSDGEDEEDTDDPGDTGETDPPSFDAVAELKGLLIGHFDSSEHAARDRDYLDILLTMCPVEMPDLGEHVLYVEQTAADTPTEPYRQRLYVLEPGATENQAVSRVFEIGGPRQYIGTCNDVEAFELELDRAIELEGCAVVLDWDGTRFVGGTVEDACGTDWGGAVYATSEITVDAAMLVSWDRGFDGSDNQVWGATGGGYEFVRQTDLGAW